LSGHSKWSSIKHQKAVTDARRGQLFTKLTREIIIAVRESGSNPDMNFRLRLAIDHAKQANLPKENIERAIQRGTGELKGEVIEEISFEGYGPDGTALIVEVVTDNRNRAVADIRRWFNRLGGSLGETGCVAWQFEPKGYITITPDEFDPLQLFEWAAEAGAEDVVIGEDLMEVYTALKDFKAVQDALLHRGV